MSTRCQIAFYEKLDAKIKSADVFVYKHSDGYPEHTLPLIEKFANEFHAKRGLDDTMYATARCVQFLANNQDTHIKKKDSEYMFLGFGVDTVIHVDIEYFYHVSPVAIQVFQVTGENPNQWELIKSVALKAAQKERPL